LIDSKTAKPLKILVVHEISYPTKVIYEVHEFPELLSLRGHDVTFIDFAEDYRGRPGKNPRQWLQRGRVYPEAQIKLHSPWLSGIEAIDRLVGVVSIWGVLWSLRKDKFDVILNFAVPTYGLQMICFGFFKRIPVVHRALDVSHKIRVSPWNPLISLVERAVLTLSTAVSANNPAMADYVRSRKSRKNGEVQVHYPPTGNADWHPLPFSEELADRHGISKDDFVIAYLGSFFYFSGLDQVIRDFAQAVKMRTDIKLLLIGGGEQESLLRRLVLDLNLSGRVVFTGFIEYQSIPKYLSLADVGINPMEVSDVSDYALPNKVIQYLQLRIPVVSTWLKGLSSALSEDPTIFWAVSSKEVIASCLNIKFRKKFIKTSAVSTSPYLAQFEPSSAIENLEKFLSSATLRGLAPKDA
jgi:glycosyltransferase involved in cell wall biosynthesis